MRPPPDAVVFDLDGVLVDSEPVWEVVRRGLVEQRGGTWSDEVQGRLMGMSTAEWAAYLSSLGIGLAPDEVSTTVVDRMRKAYARELPLLPGASAALQRLGARFPLGLATSSPRELVEVVLADGGLGRWFASVVSADEVNAGKPAPDVYLATAQSLEVPPARCVAVEDSSNGVLAADAAGMTVIAVPRPQYPLTAQAAGRARYVLSTLDELTVDLVADA